MPETLSRKRKKVLNIGKMCEGVSCCSMTLFANIFEKLENIKKWQNVVRKFIFVPAFNTSNDWLLRNGMPDSVVQ